MIELNIGVRVRHANGTCGVDAILPQNTIVPVKKTVQLRAHDDRHTSIRIEVVHGCNFTLWTADVPLKGEGIVDITLEVDVSGLLYVTVDDKSGSVVQETIKDGMPRALINDETRSLECTASCVSDTATSSYPASRSVY